MKKMNRLTSVLLMVAMLLTLLPAMALTAVADVNVWDGSIASGFNGGSGSTGDPYQIATGAQLAYLAQQVNSSTGGDNWSAGKYFKLTADIDLNNEAWTPIGNSLAFAGTFDGQGYSITGLNVCGDFENAGLFGCAQNATLQNLRVSGTIKVISNVDLDCYAGGVVGNIQPCNVSSCYSDAVVTVINNSTDNDVSAYAGGIVGYAWNAPDNDKISDCYHSIGAVTVTTAGMGGAFAGGIAGFIFSGDLDNCRSDGAVTANCPASSDSLGANSWGAKAGGIVGYINGNVSYCCHYTGAVTATGVNNYSGDIAGGSNSINKCYYLADTTGSNGALSAVDFKDQSKFIDWNFTDVWYMGAEAPILQALIPRVRSWSALQTALTSGCEMVILDGDITASEDNGPLTVPSGRTVTLNLNGHVLDRGKSNASSTNTDCNVINVLGNLTLKDSNSNATHSNSALPVGGVITGGNGDNHGGGVYVDGGTFIMNGGAIFGNKGYSGGGVNMYSGTFTMNGGTISSNSATSNYGGGVYVSGGRGTFSMNGGVITDNSAAGQGGGVYVSRSDFAFNVSGSPQITGNTKGGVANNVFVDGSSTAKITGVGTLTSGASIGVSMTNGYNAVTLTEGASFANDTAAQTYFFADNSSGYMITVADNQAVLSPKPATAPTIYTQPVSPGTPLAYDYTASGVTLSVAASAATGADYTLSYQWYKGDNESLTLDDSTKISGATGVNYTVPTGLGFGTHYYKCVATATRNDNGQSASATSCAAAVQVGYSVGITAGAGMTLSSGTATQTVVSGAMNDVYYSANDGYYFPEDYSSASANGITVSREDLTQIKVSGTPTGNTALELTAATAKEKETTPTTASFAAVGYDTGTLSGLTSGMKYSTDGTNWTDITSDEDIALTGLTAPCTISVVKKGNDTTTLDSDAQTIEVTQAATPTLTVNQATSFGSKGSVTIPNTDGVTYEQSVTGTGDWADCDAGTQELDQDSTIYIRVKASGAVLASENQTVTINIFGGTPEDTPNATFTATGLDSGELSGLAANAAYTITGAGLTESEITADADGKYAITSGMEAGTLSVVKKGNGTETNDSAAQSIVIDKAVVPTGLSKVDCTTAANNDGKLTDVTAEMEYRKSDADSWSDGTGSAFTGLVPGTYYVRVKAADRTLASDNQELTIKAFISATVTFKVINGSWDEGEGEAATADRTVTLTGHEGDTLKLTADQIPTVGSKPNDTYKAGSWDVMPSTETVITVATSYTYTYAKKEAAVVTKAPTAKILTCNGQAQELVTAGEATGGTMVYALGTDATTAPADNLYTTSIPAKTDTGTYYVWYKVVGDENHTDSAPACVEVIIQGTPEVKQPAAAEEKQTEAAPVQAVPVENTAPSQEFLLQSGFRVYNHGDAITVKWGNATEADSYDVFAQYCGNKKFKKIKTVTGRKYTFKKLNSKKLDLTNCVKVYVVAMKSGQKIASTQTGHIACRKSKYTNVKRIIVPKATIKLKAGKTKKLKVSVRLENGGKKEIKAKDHHCSRFIYATSNKAVATVSKNGKIRAVAPGTCDIWIYAMNGVSKNVKVVVQ